MVLKMITITRNESKCCDDPKNRVFLDKCDECKHFEICDLVMHGICSECGDIVWNYGYLCLCHSCVNYRKENNLKYGERKFIKIK